MSDLSAEMVRFGTRLRQHGLPADAERIRLLITALPLIDPMDPSQVRAASRSLTCTNQRHIAIHDAVFDRFFGLGTRGGSPPPATEVEMPEPAPATGPAASEGEDETMAPRARASRLEVLRTTDLGAGGRAEEAARLIERIDFRSPRQRAHRLSPGGFGRTDVRQVFKDLVRQEEISRIPRASHRDRPRDVTVVADVSASMKQWLPAIIRFLARTTQCLQARSFAAGTRLTRVDQYFGPPLTESSLRFAKSTIPDFSGGTRLGESLLSLVNGRHREAVRASVFVLISDGWEQGDCSQLRAASARLARLTHRFIWVNPRAGRVGFSPEARGMRVAAEFAEVVLPATTVDGWQSVADAIMSKTSVTRGVKING